MMEDLTKIERPFGLLDPETQQALKNWPHGLEYFDGYRWFSRSFRGHGLHLTYRAIPASKTKTKPSLDWSHAAPEYKWIARDSDGEGYLYDRKPPKDGRGWWVADGKVCEASVFASYDQGTCDWDESLVCRPGCEDEA